MGKHTPYRFSSDFDMTFSASTTRQSKTSSRRVCYWVQGQILDCIPRPKSNLKVRTCFVRGSTSKTSSPSTMVFLKSFEGSWWWGKTSPVNSRYSLWRSIWGSKFENRSIALCAWHTRYTVCKLDCIIVLTKKSTLIPSDFSQTQKLTYKLNESCLWEQFATHSWASSLSRSLNPKLTGWAPGNLQ